MDANTAFDQYREMYFEGGVSSVYLWDLEIDANTAFDQDREVYFEGGVSSVYLWDCEHVDHGDCDHGDHDFAGGLNSEHQLSV